MEGIREFRERAEHLQQRLLRLVDDDATAYGAFIAARRAGQVTDSAVAGVINVPLQVATACAEVVHVTRQLQERTEGPITSDVRAARHLAQAAMVAALDLAEQNVALLGSDAAARQRVRDEIARLRRSG
jgi:formiminotetrahydrofolate cyclodeaminase